MIDHIARVAACSEPAGQKEMRRCGKDGGQSHQEKHQNEVASEGKGWGDLCVNLFRHLRPPNSCSLPCFVAG